MRNKNYQKVNFSNKWSRNQNENTKYLGVILDEHLNFKKQIETVKQKLARETGVLPKLRHDVPKKVLKLIYYAVFDSNIRYTCQIWGQNFSTS